MSEAAEDCVKLVAPNPGWRTQFEKEAAEIRAALASHGELRLEHIGSTAVPGLRAKPVIDILIIHPAVRDWPQLRAPLEVLGYVYWADNPRKDRMFFVKGMPPFGAGRTHHVHVRLPGDASAELRFRDLLCANTTLAREYQQLKERLASEHPSDRERYTAGKSRFIAEALSQDPLHR